MTLKSDDERTQSQDLQSRVRWLQQRARAQLRHALNADNLYDKDERLSIAIILYDHAAAVAEHDPPGRLSTISS